MGRSRVLPSLVMCWAFAVVEGLAPSPLIFGIPCGPHGVMGRIIVKITMVINLTHIYQKLFREGVNFIFHRVAIVSLLLQSKSQHGLSVGVEHNISAEDVFPHPRQSRIQDPVDGGIYLFRGDPLADIPSSVFKLKDVVLCFLRDGVLIDIGCISRSCGHSSCWRLLGEDHREPRPQPRLPREGESELRGGVMMQGMENRRLRGRLR